MVLFHLTISHSPQDCPGRRPSQPPALVAPSDTRSALEQELGVTLHFVLWGASCMLWAQPEHLAFAVLEAADLESISRYVDALVPAGWTCVAQPVWNLPAQLRLVRQVGMASAMEFGQALASANSSSASEPPVAEAPRPDPTATQQSGPALASAVDADEAVSEVADRVAKEPPGATSDNSPGTITRLLRELDAAPTSPGEWQVVRGGGKDGPGQSPTPTQILSEVSLEPPPAARAWLVSIAGPARGKTFSVGGQGATIGRIPDLAVCISDERLSREHARIDFRDGGYWLTDLASTHGTALNGTPLAEPQHLQSGDSIEVGASVLVVTIEPNPGL